MESGIPGVPAGRAFPSSLLWRVVLGVLWVLGVLGVGSPQCKSDLGDPLAKGAFPGLRDKARPGVGRVQVSQETPAACPKQGPVPGGEAGLLPVLSCPACLPAAVTSTFPVPCQPGRSRRVPSVGCGRVFQTQLQLVCGKC